MAEIRLRDKLISVLGIENHSEAEKEYIVNNLTRLAVDKTMEDVMDEMSPEELTGLQQYIAKNEKDLPEMQEKYKKNLETFFIFFNKNIDELVGEFQKNIK